MNNDPQLNLQLTLSETNQILTHLGTLPYNQVANLVLKLQAQAQLQLQAQTPRTSASTPAPAAQPAEA